MKRSSPRVRLEGEAVVPADRALFCRALNNLLHNAIKHAPSGQEVMVRIELGHDGPRISVSNPGAAIEHRHLKQLFDRGAARTILSDSLSARQVPAPHAGLTLPLWDLRPSNEPVVKR